MSWRDGGHRDADDPNWRFGRPGGDWQGIRPTFDNPLTWSLPIGRVSGIDVRVHVLFLVFIVIELLRASVPPSIQGASPLISIEIMALVMAALFVIVLAHEFGHCIACRHAGGQANEILMWPLGGLAIASLPIAGGADMVTVLGGPLVNVLICLVAGLTLGLVSGRWLGIALVNPLSMSGLRDPAIASSWPLLTLFIINWLSFVLLLFNLLPIFPLDGGRIVQAGLWARVGYNRSMRLAVRTGYVGAILLGIFGAVQSRWMLVGIALFGGITCYLTQRQLAFTEEMLGFESDEYMLGRSYEEEPQEPARSSRSERRAQRRAEREATESQEVDRILQKIAETGLESLSRTERRVLKSATQRRRGPE